jgi:hypothetical protein
LPNIDINIKCGNSLISRFDLDEDLKPALQKSKFTITSYRAGVQTYRHAQSKDEKREMQQLINTIKNDFETFVSVNDKRVKDLSKKRGELFKLTQRTELFIEPEGKKTNEWKKQFEKINREITTQEAVLEDIKNNRIYSNAFEWRFEFPEVLDNEGIFVGFDIVIGNPPYGVTYNDQTKKYLKESYPGIQQKMFDPFLFFISLSIKLLKNEGVTSFIVPNNLIFQMTFEKGREYLLENTSVNTVINLGDKIFEDADVPTCLYVARKKVSADYIFNFLDVRDSKEKNNFSENLRFEQYSKSQLLQTYALVFGVKNSNLELMKKLSFGSVKLDEIIEMASYGIGTGGDKIFRIKKEVCTSLKLEDDILYKVISGNNISKYALRYENEKIIYTTKDVDIQKHPNILNYLLPFKDTLSNKRETKKGTLPWWCLHWPRNKNLYLGKKIILRQTGDRIIASYDDESYFVMDSVMVIKMKAGFEFQEKYLLAILNSKLSEFLYSNIAQEKGRVFAQVKPQNVRQLLIKNISADLQLPIVNLVDRILAEKNINLKADTTSLEAEVDKLIYKIFDLTNEEITLIESR